LSLLHAYIHTLLLHFLFLTEEPVDQQLHHDVVNMTPHDKFIKLLDDLKALFEEKDYAVHNIVIHLSCADKSGTTVFSNPDASQNILTVDDILFHLSRECRYYSYSLLQNFVEGEEYKNAKPMVEKYTSLVYSQLLEDMNLITANEGVKPGECPPLESISILEVKIEKNRLLLKEEKDIVKVFYRYLKLPDHSLHFIGAKPGSIILVYKLSAKVKELLFNLTAKKLGVLVNLNITHLVIDNELELNTMAIYYDKVRIVTLAVKTYYWWL